MTHPNEQPATESAMLAHPVSWLGRLLPHPFLTVFLLLSWLLLNHSLAPGHWVLGGFAALLIPKLVQRFILPNQPIAWGVAFRLLAVVAWDIVVANVRVALLVLGPMERLKPAWIRIPLASTHPKVNTFLALIISTTPGTMSVGLDDAQNNILVHALNTHDPDAVIAEIKRRYEQPLLAMFHINPAQQDNNLPPPSE